MPEPIGYILASVPTVPTPCPDPDGHDRLMAQREATWRERARSGVTVKTTRCLWCGGALIDTPAAVAYADLQAELAAEAREAEWQMRTYCDD